MRFLPCTSLTGSLLFDSMKRISILLVATAFCAIAPARAQDAATEERLNKLNGSIQDILAAQETLSKQIQSLSREVSELRERASTPAGNYADQGDLKHLESLVKEVDRKRMEDNDKIQTQLKAVRDALLKAPVASSHPSKNSGGSLDTKDNTPASVTSKGSDQGFEYIIQKGDTLSLIVQAYKEKNIKVTADQILKANPGLKAERMPVGKKIFIPAPASLASSQ